MVALFASDDKASEPSPDSNCIRVASSNNVDDSSNLFVASLNKASSLDASLFLIQRCQYRLNTTSAVKTHTLLLKTRAVSSFSSVVRINIQDDDMLVAHA